MIDENMHRATFGDGREAALDFSFWSVRPEIVRDNVARYVAGTGETICCVEVAGRYEKFVADGFAQGCGPDVFYAQRAEASLWDSQGHIAWLDEADPPLATLLPQMDRRLVEGARNANGRLLGLTHYNGGPFTLFVHERFAAGIDPSALTTWDGVLEQLRRARRDGLADHPFLPRWHNAQTGLIWSLLCHLATEGVLSFDDPEAGKALEQALGFFQALVEEALVPIESLDDRGDGAALRRWVSGAHVLTFTTDYLARDAAEAAGNAANVTLPRLPGRAGTPLMPGHALLCMNASLHGRARTRATALLAYLGGPLVHRRWLQQCLFGVAYPALAMEADTRAAMATAFPGAHAHASLAHMLAARADAVVSPPTHVPSMLAWTSTADGIIREDLLRRRRLSPAAASDALLQAWCAHR